MKGVIILASTLLVLIGAGALALLVLGGAGKMTSLMWWGRRKKKISDQEKSGNPRCDRCGRDLFVGVQHYCRP